MCPSSGLMKMLQSLQLRELRDVQKTIVTMAITCMRYNGMLTTKLKLGVKIKKVYVVVTIVYLYPDLFVYQTTNQSQSEKTQ